MAFYRSKYTYEDAAPLIQKFKGILNQSAHRVINEEDEDMRNEWYFFTGKVPEDGLLQFRKLFAYLERGGFIKGVPTDGGLFIIFNESANGKTPTVSPSHVRLPKLSHLITLVPEDFFALIRLVYTAKSPAPGVALQLNPPAAGITDLTHHPISQFFTLLKTNYRMNTDYADRKWTRRDALSLIADLEPTRDNQLSAMQYLTALQNSDLLYFPVDTRIELDLDWTQVSDDYCIPQSTDNQCRNTP